VRPGGRFAVVEMLLGEVGERAFAPLMDLNMMVMLSGRERTLDEYRRLMTDGGLGEVTVTPANTPMTILGAIAA
jgi:O-methyltransferase domain